MSNGGRLVSSISKATYERPSSEISKTTTERPVSEISKSTTMTLLSPEGINSIDTRCSEV